MGIKKRVIGVDAGGKLALKAPDGAERKIGRAQRSGFVYLLLDCSGSMLDHMHMVRQGAEDFARAAVSDGYWVGVISFANEARIELQPQSDARGLSLEQLTINAGGGTNMTAALALGLSELRSKPGARAIVLVTDGKPNDPASALMTAELATREGVRVIAIGTGEADLAFLSRLSTARDLAQFVARDELRAGVASAAKLLAPGPGRQPSG